MKDGSWPLYRRVLSGKTNEEIVPPVIPIAKESLEDLSEILTEGMWQFAVFACFIHFTWGRVSLSMMIVFYKAVSSEHSQYGTIIVFSMDRLPTLFVSGGLFLYLPLFFEVVLSTLYLTLEIN